MSKLWSSMLILAVALFVAVGSARAAEGKKKDGKKRERPSAEQIFKKPDTLPIHPRRQGRVEQGNHVLRRDRG